jgi:hypothetical protein
MPGTDERGAQLSQECPHPSAIQWEQEAARHDVIVSAASSNWARTF